MTQRISRMSGRSRSWRQDDGAALLFVLMGMAVLTAVGVSMVGLGMVSRTMTTSERETAEALAIADAGVAHAQRLVLWQEWFDHNQLLQNGNGIGCDGDELASQPAGPIQPGYPTASTDFIPQAGRAYGVGTYQVFICDDDVAESTAPADPAVGLPDADPNTDVNRQLILRVVGNGRNGATATVEVLLGPRISPAIIIDGDAWLSGSVNSMGAAGGIHTNGELEISGNVCAEQFFGSEDDIVVSGGSVAGGAGCVNGTETLEPYSAPLNIPLLDPTLFQSMATYRLENNGQIRDPMGGLIPGGLPGLVWNNGQKLWASTTSVLPGTYYVDANFRLGASPGPISMTIIAVGYIDIGGTPNTLPDICPPYPGCISAIAGTDLQIQGGSNSFAGLYYARHQLEITGTPNINGQVIASNEADTCNTGYLGGLCNLVPLTSSGQMHISGSPVVTYNGGGLTSTVPRKWRECRGPNPANPCGPLFGNQPGSPITRWNPIEAGSMDGVVLIRKPSMAGILGPALALRPTLLTVPIS